VSDELNIGDIVESKSEETQTEEATQVAETDWKSEARKWEKRAKEANGYKEAAEKWLEYEKSQKPEAERLFDELANARKEAESAKVSLLRYEVAAAKGIPAEAVKLMSGASREELEESADTLMALIAKQSETKSLRPDPTQGRVTTAGNSTQDQFAAAISNIL
jgi:hypothetical protein